MVAGAPPLLIGQAPAAAASTAVAGVTVPAARAPAACPSLADGAGRSPDLACLNQQLKPAQDAPAQPDAATAAGSQDVNRTGLYDRAGTAQRLGPNFGHASAPPPRPVPVYPAFGGASAATPK